MEKLVGMLCILVGCGGMMISWQEKKRRQQIFMRECIRLFARWKFALSKEHMRLYDFLEEYDGRSPEMEQLLLQLKEQLKKNCYPSGNQVWQELLREKRALLPLGDEAYRILLDAGDAFFGSSSEDCLRCIKACGERMEEALAEEKKDMEQKWKVYMPVGMLGGMILIILLI